MKPLENAYFHIGRVCIYYVASAYNIKALFRFMGLLKVKFLVHCVLVHSHECHSNSYAFF